jgi:DNA polymerase IV
MFYLSNGWWGMAEQGRTWVIHADLDAFFAAAEVLRNPDLAGKPVIVGGSPGGRGVVSSASYEARAFGVRSAMPVAQAARLCPEGIFIHPDGTLYRDLSHRFREILDEFSPIVEVVSVDEAYLDASYSERLFGGAVELARSLKARVKEELGLVVSLGVAPNRLIAKIASDLDKPDGLRIVPHGTEATFLAPLSIDRMPGIGPKAAVTLRAHGIETLGQLATASDALLQSIAGRHADTLRVRALGQYIKPVRSDHDPAKSLGHERTFSHDLRKLDEMRAALFSLAERSGADLRKRGLACGVVTLKLRYSDFSTVNRQRSLERPTDAHQEIFAVAADLLQLSLRERSDPVRLIGLRLSRLSEPASQLDLFDDRPERTRRLNHALDGLAERHGDSIVRPAGFFSNTPKTVIHEGREVK